MVSKSYIELFIYIHSMLIFLCSQYGNQCHSSSLLHHHDGEHSHTGKLGRFPPIMHHHPVPSDGPTPGARFQRSHLAEAFAKAKGSSGGTGGGSGRGLMGQIIPIYGFGIFLYILYILFKVSGIILIISYFISENHIILIKIIIFIKTL